MGRGKNLDPNDVARILSILDGWSGPLTWELLLSETQKRLFWRYSRQTLSKHDDIQRAFTQRRKAPAGVLRAKKASTPEMQVATDHLARLEAENERLKMENTALLEQFVRWTYNANNRNLSEEFLNQPLPPVHREQTRLAVVAGKAAR